MTESSTCILVSVVIPTKNRPELLARCLAALVDQTADPASFEIVVVDDGDREDARTVVETISRRDDRPIPSIEYRRTQGSRGPAAARNVGWTAARGKIIAFTDDDCVPDPGWVASGAGALNDGVAGVSGRIVVPLPSPPTDYELNVAGLEIAEFATANCFYLREALTSAGGFDERFTMAWREDADLFLTLLEQGRSLARAPEAVVVHPVRPARWGISLAQQRKSLFNALLYKKHPHLYRQRVQPAPPWHYYAMVGSLLTAIASAALKWRELAAASGAVWLLLAGCFCRRRLQRTAATPGHVTEMVVTSLLIPPLAVFWRLRGAIKYRALFL